MGKVQLLQSVWLGQSRKQRVARTRDCPITFKSLFPLTYFLDSTPHLVYLVPPTGKQMLSNTVFLTKAYLDFRGLEDTEEFMQIPQPRLLSPPRAISAKYR